MQKKRESNLVCGYCAHHGTGPMEELERVEGVCRVCGYGLCRSCWPGKHLTGGFEIHPVCALERVVPARKQRG